MFINNSIQDTYRLFRKHFNFLKLLYGRLQTFILYVHTLRKILIT